MKKISRTAKFLALLASFCVPLFAAAQINTTLIKGYSDSITGIINSILVPVLIAIAFITFLWGVYKYFILGAADEKSRTDGRQFTLWGIIGFVIIVSLWAIVNLFMGTLGLSAGTAAPKFPTIGTGSYTVPSGTTVGGTNGGTGSNVFSSNGTLLGKVNSSGQIVSSSGQTVGKINSNGQAVTNSGTPISGTTVTSGTGGSSIQSGGDCTYNPNGCATGLHCVSDSTGTFGTCQATGGATGTTGIQSGGDCTYNPNGCATGLSCVTDASDVGTCKTPNPFSGGLSCTYPDCNAPNSCALGWSCVGYTSNSCGTCESNSSTSYPPAICQDVNAANDGYAGPCTYNP